MGQDGFTSRQLEVDRNGEGTRTVTRLILTCPAAAIQVTSKLSSLLSLFAEHGDLVGFVVELDSVHESSDQ